MTTNDVEELIDLCRKYLKDNRVYHEDCINDDMQVNALEFIHEIANLVGYAEHEE